jgi:hypothetical protein
MKNMMDIWNVVESSNQRQINESHSILGRGFELLLKKKENEEARYAENEAFALEFKQTFKDAELVKVKDAYGKERYAAPAMQQAGYETLKTLRKNKAEIETFGLKPFMPPDWETKSPEEVDALKTAATTKKITIQTAEAVFGENPEQFAELTKNQPKLKSWKERYLSGDMSDSELKALANRVSKEADFDAKMREALAKEKLDRQTYWSTTGALAREERAAKGTTDTLTAEQKNAPMKALNKAKEDFKKYTAGITINYKMGDKSSTASVRVAQETGYADKKLAASISARMAVARTGEKYYAFDGTDYYIRDKGKKALIKANESSVPTFLQAPLRTAYIEYMEADRLLNSSQPETTQSAGSGKTLTDAEWEEIMP